MELPTRNECLEYFDQFKVPENIKKHCLKVTEIAVFIAKKKEIKDKSINVKFVEKIALLHDLFKVVAIKKLERNKFYNVDYSEEEIEMWKQLRKKYEGMYENQVAHLFFKDKYPELAEALKEVSNLFDNKRKIEVKIAHYADWRSLNNQVTTIKVRLSDLEKRYPNEKEYWESRAELMLKIEDEIFKDLMFLPKELDLEMKKNG